MQIPSELKSELDALPPDFYGSVELTFQDGLPILIKIVATRKIYRERDNRHGHQSR